MLGDIFEIPLNGPFSYILQMVAGDNALAVMSRLVCVFVVELKSQAIL